MGEYGIWNILLLDEEEQTEQCSPEYLSPEVILNGNYIMESDWWQFGVLIYELLFGITPFYTEN